jgi:predicted O-linked N-acetylglucosamine transferase (SPINDLY family)
MNSIVDLLSVGLTGVCKTGREPHEHIDHGLFERLGLPQWLIAKTTDDYIKSALRLINNHEERLEIRNQVHESGALKTLFEGRADLFGIEVKKLLKNKIKSCLR